MHTITQPTQAASFILQETANRLVERLSLLKIHPKNILLHDNSKALDSQQLIMLFPDGIITHEPQENMHYDLIIDNCSLIDVADIRVYLFVMKKLLNTNGLLIFCTLGLETFPQYRLHMKPDLKLTDMHNLGDLMLNLHFADPVMEMEILNLNYNHPATLINDLKHANLLAEHPPLHLPSPIHTTIELIYGHAWHKLGFENQFTDEHNTTWISADSIEYMD